MMSISKVRGQAISDILPNAQTFPTADAQLGWFRVSGLAVVRGNELVPPTIAHLEKLKELVSKAEEPLYFLVIAAADNRVARIDTFRDRSEWVENLKDWGLQFQNSIFEHASADQGKQLRCIDKLLAIAKAGL